MEELLIAVFEIVFEIILQILIQIPWDLGLSFGERRASEADHDANYLLWIVGSLLAGALIGGISLLAFPHTFITHSWARITYLALAPLLSGFLSYFLAKNKSSIDVLTNRPRMHALCLFLFSLGITVIRFTYAQR
jgi:hypothetical protein